VIHLLDVKDNKVYVEMGGGCHGCGMARMTLKAGVEAMILEEFPEITEVIDQTDHDMGHTPFFERNEE
jgi:Fe/S biogenesis protein NfuA